MYRDDWDNGLGFDILANPPEYGEFAEDVVLASVMDDPCAFEGDRVVVLPSSSDFRSVKNLRLARSFDMLGVETPLPLPPLETIVRLAEERS